MKNLIFYTTFVFIFIASNAVAGALVPNTFTNGEVISSSKMNQNFTTLESKLNNAIVGVAFTTRFIESNGNTSGTYTSEIVTLTCNTGEILTGGSCSCSSSGFNSSTTNFGVLSFCGIAGNSVIGGCYADEGTINIAKYGPAVTAYGICASDTTVQDTIASPAGIASIATSTAPEQTPQALNEEALSAIQNLNAILAEREQLLK